LTAGSRGWHTPVPADILLLDVRLFGQRSQGGGKGAPATGRRGTNSSRWQAHSCCQLLLHCSRHRLLLGLVLLLLLLLVLLVLMLLLLLLRRWSADVVAGQGVVQHGVAAGGRWNRAVGHR